MCRCREQIRTNVLSGFTYPSFHSSLGKTVIQLQVINTIDLDSLISEFPMSARNKKVFLLNTNVHTLVDIFTQMLLGSTLLLFFLEGKGWSPGGAP